MNSVGKAAADTRGQALKYWSQHNRVRAVVKTAWPDYCGGRVASKARLRKQRIDNRSPAANAESSFTQPPDRSA